MAKEGGSTSAGSDADSFATFSEYLVYLRRRAELTQREFGAAVGYSYAHIARLENNQRLPDVATVRARFITALGLQHEPKMAARLVQLAQQARSATDGTPIAQRATNLPAQLTHFVGREQEVAEIRRLLATNRFITLTGAGGVGKTRLGLEVAASLLSKYPDGVWLVELAPLAEAGLVPDAVATVLGVRRASRSALVVLSEYLLDRRVLLILDNCEHVIQACAEVAEALLRTCPQLRILATSREALNIPGEVTWRVPSLAADEAAQLFTERAGAVKLGFEVTPANAPYVAQICRQLDGLPLAVELAAARLRTFSVEQIAGLLDDRFRLLTGGARTALPRQQTLRATVDWSYDLLSREERALLRRLAVFAGGWTFEAAEAVWADKQDVRSQRSDVRGIEPLRLTPDSCHHTSDLCLLTSDILPLHDNLVNKSLVTVEESPSGPRYRLLETIRQYAHAKLVDAGEETQTRQRHLEYFASLAETTRSHYWETQEQAIYYDILEPEFDNSRAALNWAAQSGDWQAGWRLIENIRNVWYERGLGNELTKWIEENLIANQAVSDPVSLRALCILGRLATFKGDMVRSTNWFRLASTCAHQLKDEPLIFWVDYHLGNGTPDYAEATALLREARQWAHQAGRKDWETLPMVSLGQRMQLHGDYQQATIMLEKATAQARETRDDRTIEWALQKLGQLLLEQGDYARARSVLEESLTLSRKNGEPAQFVVALVDLGTTALYQGDYALVREALSECIPFQYKVDNLERVAQGFVLADGLAKAKGELAQAARLLGAVAAIRRDHHTHGVFERELFAEYDRRLPTVRAELAPADFDKAWAEGQQMTLKQAMQEALAV